MTPTAPELSARARHWDEIYASRDESGLGWFETSPATIDEVRTALEAGAHSVIDVGAGSSRLVDELLELGVDDVTLLDVSEEALDAVARRLGERSRTVAFELGDVTDFAPDRTWTLWHDRAVFHFLTDVGDRIAYRTALARSLPDGGFAIVATFGPDGPDRCAGLPVVRYDGEALVRELADVVDCVGCRTHEGSDPGTDNRPYVICLFRKPTGSIVAPEQEN